jgi:hypothetical protein
MTMQPTDAHKVTSTQPIPTNKYMPGSSAPMLHINIGFALITLIFSVRYHYQRWGTIFWPSAVALHCDQIRGYNTTAVQPQPFHLLRKLYEVASTRSRVAKGRKLTKLWPKLSHQGRHHYWLKNTSWMTRNSWLQFDRCTTAALSPA